MVAQLTQKKKGNAYANCEPNRIPTPVATRGNLLLDIYLVGEVDYIYLDYDGGVA